jgi:hypothetical protein
MSKFVNITVSTNLSTDFYIEVPDNASNDDIKKLAEKEIIFPNKYPEFIDKMLKDKCGININIKDSLLKNWNIINTEYIIK